MKRFKSIVIGCGRIGAFYDLHKKNLILSHAKGYFMSNHTQLKIVIDPDEKKALQIAKEYCCEHARSICEVDIKDVDFISICTPTKSHFEILCYLYQMNYKNYIVLEKPILFNSNEIDEVLGFDRDFLEKIYVNYIRRYDPKYHEILLRLKKGNFSPIKIIFVNYFGTFKDNGIHALNLTNYIFGITPACVYNDQQTIVLQYNDSKVIFSQIKSNYLNYTIDIYTEKNRILFDNLGYSFHWFKETPSTMFDNALILNQIENENVLNSYIVSLIDKIANNDKNLPTIFEGINDLKIIEEIEKCSR